MKKILMSILLIFGLLAPAIVWAANVYPAAIRRGNVISYSWTLVTNQTVTGDSNTAKSVAFCAGPKVLIFKTSGATVNITFDIKEDSDAVTTKSLTVSTAGTIKLSANHHISELYITSTITDGQVDSIKLTCN
jgi:hypothetical protein